MSEQEAWTGKVSEAEMYDHALTDEEIAALMERRYSTPEPLAYWPLSEPPEVKRVENG